jgi:hypothetical protein
VYYYLCTIDGCASATLHALAHLRTVTGPSREAWLALARLVPMHDDMRHCWYASAPYVSRWRWDAEQCALAVERRRGRADARTDDPFREHAADCRRRVVGAGAYARALGVLLEDELPDAARTALGRDMAALCAALRSFTGALDRLIGATRASPMLAFAVLSSLEWAGNGLCEASARSLGPTYQLALARLAAMV